MKKVIIFLTSVCLFCSLAVSTKVVKANSNDYFKGQTLTIMLKTTFLKVKKDM